MAMTLGTRSRETETAVRGLALDAPGRATDLVVTKSVPAAARVAPLFRAPGWVWRRFGRVGWWVRSGWERRLLDQRGLPLEEWRRDGRLRTIKTGPHRVVYRAELADEAVYIKHYKIPSWREMLRQWFRRGKGRNEAKRALKLAELGVTTITPIALGEQRKHKFLFENYLISPEIAGAVPLDEFVEKHMELLPEPERVRLRQALAVEVARLTARLHEARFVHQDFHPGNILVRRSAGGSIELAMIDLDALRVRRRLSWRGAKANLALLNHYFWCRCERSDRHRFLRAYLEQRGQPRGELKSFALEIEHSTRRWAERLWRRWGRRCRGSNKYFRVYRTVDAWAVGSRRLDKAEVKRVVGDPDAVFSWPGTRQIKDSRTTTVAEARLEVDGKPVPVIFKRFNCKKRLDPVLALFRPTRGWRAWQAGQHLASRGIPTPANLLYIRKPAPRSWWNPLGLLPGDTYVVTLKADQATTLFDHVRQELGALGEDERRRRTRDLIRALARAIRLMHDRSLAHRDLKAANILVEGEATTGNPLLSFIDLVGVELRHPLPRSRWIQNLARLHLSLEGLDWRTRSDALRFLRGYLDWSRTRRPEWKRVWREVSRVAEAKREQNRRRGRILS